MDDLILIRDLVAQGYSRAELVQLARRDDLVRLRRGAYVSRHTAAPVSAEERYARRRTEQLRLIEATRSQLHPRHVLSHVSAAAVHGLPLFESTLGLVHVTRDRHGGGVVRQHVRVHGSVLRPEDRAAVDGLPVTSLARTTCDLARTLSYDQAVAVGDQALRLGLTPAALTECLEQAASWHGIAQARRVAPFLDARSESVGESFSRIQLAALHLAPSQLQYEIVDERGRLIGRSDFAWPQHRTLGEFDGMEKYGRLRRPGETVQQAVIREKLREDALRDLGWQVTRWVWDDLRTPQVIADRLTRAFARGAR